jgi:putative ABC transport system ATP-binding protein
MDDTQSPLVLEAEQVSKGYPEEHNRQVLSAISFAVRRGKFVALTGPSGSGKSTLLGILGALDRDYSGVVRVAGSDLRSLRDDDLTRLRRTQIGFVFQQFYLLPDSTAFQNVEMPLIFAGLRGPVRRERALRALEIVGMAEAERRPVTQLSGGERQRVAIARALVHDPSVLLADEPTGSLDQTTGAHIIDLFATLNQEHGLTIFLVTHDPSVAQRADYILSLRDGRLITKETGESKNQQEVTHAQ